MTVVLKLLYILVSTHSQIRGKAYRLPRTIALLPFPPSLPSLPSLFLLWLGLALLLLSLFL